MTTKTTFRFFLFGCIVFIFANCEEPGTHSTPPYDGPPKDFIISQERAQEIYNSYTQRRVSIIKKFEDSITSDGSKFTPTRYAEYDYETIKQYMAYIEHEAQQAQVEIKTLRFYLSNYPDSEKFPDGQVVKYPKRNSFFVLPTMDYEGKNVGFSVVEKDGKYTAVPLRKNAGKENDASQKSKDSAGQMNEAGFFLTQNDTTQNGGNSSLILNDSHLSPPPYGPDDFGVTD